MDIGIGYLAVYSVYTTEQCAGMNAELRFLQGQCCYYSFVNKGRAPCAKLT